jgi:glycosyltransferase involved in cell wall biosynthesis
MADLGRALPTDAAVLPSLDEEAWIARASAFLRDEGLRRRAADDGAALVRRRFDWAEAAARLADLYAEVLAERRPARGVA